MNEDKKKHEKRRVSGAEIIVLLVALFGLFGLGTFLELNYVVLMIFITALTIFIAFRCGYTWKEVELAAASKIKDSITTIILLLAIGFMLGGLMFSGIVPMFLCYGLKIISPQWIALCGFVISMIFSTATGTSNGTASTVGMAVMIMAMAMTDVNLGLVAGACYAGAIFGDKLSPVSDTTILATVVADVDIFDHLYNQGKVVVPAAVIAFVVYFVYGLNSNGDLNSGASSAESAQLITEISSLFKFSWVCLIPLAFIIWGSIRGKNTSFVLFGTGFIGMLVGVLYQGFSLTDGVCCLYDGFSMDYCTANVDNISEQTVGILERGGISSMSKPFIMAIFCFCFSGIAEKIGVMQAFLDSTTKFIRGRGSLVLCTGLVTTLITMIGGSSTVSLLMSGTLCRDKYDEMGINRLNLSSTLEHFGSGVSGFFPWTSSGILYMAVLFQDTSFTFLKYGFMTWSIWILALVFAYTGFGFRKTPTKRQLAKMQQEGEE